MAVQHSFAGTHEITALPVGTRCREEGSIVTSRQKRIRYDSDVHLAISQSGYLFARASLVLAATTCCRLQKYEV